MGEKTLCDLFSGFVTLLKMSNELKYFWIIPMRGFEMISNSNQLFHSVPALGSGSIALDPNIR